MIKCVHLEDGLIRRVFSLFHVTNELINGFNRSVVFYVQCKCGLGGLSRDCVYCTNDLEISTWVCMGLI